jgi:hypothetical protein
MSREALLCGKKWAHNHNENKHIQSKGKHTPTTSFGKGKSLDRNQEFL